MKLLARITAATAAFGGGLGMMAACGSGSGVSDTTVGGPATCVATDPPQACACSTGASGTQKCKADGTGFEACSCSGDAGAAGGTGGVGGAGGTTPGTGGTASAAGGTAAAGGTGGTSAAGGSGGTAPDAGVKPGPVFTGTCDDKPPAGAVEAPDPPKYSGGTCPKLTTGNTAINTITSSGKQRQFMVIAPTTPKAGEKLPVVFLWHWLNASAQSFYDRADAQNAVDEQRFIAVIPESIGSAPSDWRGWFSLNPQSQEDEEFVFFDDMLACVSEQFSVNKNCVSTAGVSDGALWSSQLIGGRGKYLSSALVMSGGVQDPNNSATGIIKPYIPSPHAMPVLVLWGGPTDVCIILPFAAATASLEQNLIQEGHFIVECQHNCGHSEPPFTAPAGQTKFAALWQFVEDHPYWTSAGASPYQKTGLPSGFPSWCGIGPGSAVPPTDTSGCGGPGC